MLEFTSDTCGGHVRIVGTRITVNQIAVWYLQGYTAEEIADQYPHVSLGQVYATLAYYHANTQEVENALAQEQINAKQLEQGYRQAIKREGTLQSIFFGHYPWQQYDTLNRLQAKS